MSNRKLGKTPRTLANMWKVIRTCIPNKSTGKKCFSSDDKSVANNFNQLFTSVVSNAVTKIKSLAKENNYTPSNYTPSQLPFVPRSYTESEQFTFEPVECSSSRERPILGHFGSTSCNTNYSGLTMHAHLLRASDDVTSGLPQIRLAQTCLKKDFPFPNLLPAIPFSWKNYDITSAFLKVPQSLAPLSEPSAYWPPLPHPAHYR
jgi:hypothetical protein